MPLRHARGFSAGSWRNGSRRSISVWTDLVSGCGVPGKTTSLPFAFVKPLNLQAGARPRTARYINDTWKIARYGRAVRPIRSIRLGIDRADAIVGFDTVLGRQARSGS